MSVSIVTPATHEPIGLEQARDHVRADDTENAAELSGMISTARAKVERYLRRSLLTQTIDVFRDSFPGLSGVIVIPRPPTQSITSIKYLDTAGVLQTLDSSLYVVDVESEPARIWPADGETWPINQVMLNAVEIRAVAGYGDGVADIPPEIKSAMLLVIGDLFDHRSSFVLGTIASKLPQNAESLLDEFRTYIPEVFL
jgi:uncharacterized phiE125 gp8 family phage protein